MSDTPAPTKHRIINSETLIPVGVIVAVLIGLGWPAVTGVWAAARWFESQSYEQREIAKQLTLLKDSVSKDVSGLSDTFKREAWTYPMQKEFVTQLKNNNPAIVVPDAKQIRQDSQ